MLIRFAPSPRLIQTLVALALGAASAVLLSPAAASADPCSGLSCGIGGGGSSGGGNGGGGGAGGGGLGGGGGGGIPTIPGQNGGGIGGGNGGGGGGVPGPAPVPTIDWAWQARNSARLPAVKIHTWPETTKGGTRTYVQIRTGLWVDGFTTVTTDWIGPPDGSQQVRAVATPHHVHWDLVEHQLNCRHNVPNSTACGYTYLQSSAHEPQEVYRITATITWNITWECQGACDNGVTGGALQPPMTAEGNHDLTVGEIQTESKPG